MGTILSFKTFFIPKSAVMPSGELKSWFDAIDRNSDCRFMVTLETVGKSRKKKTSSIEQLRGYFAGFKHYEALLCRGDYEFNFASETYFWRGKEIYLTANEQLFLYHWLVLGREVCKEQQFFLQNIRRRLGRDFLADIREDAIKNETEV